MERVAAAQTSHREHNIFTGAHSLECTEEKKTLM